MFAKPDRLRSPAHLARLRTLPCCIPGCRGRNVVGHHLTHAQPKARGLKTGDQYAVALCFAHHDPRSRMSVHFHGGEESWWLARGVDPIAVAEAAWTETNRSKK